MRESIKRNILREIMRAVALFKIPFSTFLSLCFIGFCILINLYAKKNGNKNLNRLSTKNYKLTSKLEKKDKGKGFTTNI